MTGCWYWWDEPDLSGVFHVAVWIEVGRRLWVGAWSWTWAQQIEEEA